MDNVYENLKSVPRSEILNSGARLSAREDFMERTLAVLRGVWGKLNYLRQLRGAKGTYEHWGLVQVHGEHAASQAMADVHSELYLEVLRTPLPDLLQQLELSAEDLNCLASDIAEALENDQQKMLPANLVGGPPRHLEAVLTSISLLTKTRRSGHKIEYRLP